MNFTQAVKEEMTKQQIGQSELARRMGFTPQYVHELLTGRKRWNETTITKACEALAITMEFKAKNMNAVNLRDNAR